MIYEGNRFDKMIRHVTCEVENQIDQQIAMQDLSMNFEMGHGTSMNFQAGKFQKVLGDATALKISHLLCKHF